MSHYCQSCGMPVAHSSMQGTMADGTLSEEFCTYCYQNGAFTQDVTQEEMLETCVPHMVESGMEEKVARALLEQVLPTLSRWKK